LNQHLKRPGGRASGKSKRLLRADTIRHEAAPKDRWNKSNRPEKSSQKQAIIIKVKRKGTGANFFVGLFSDDWYGFLSERIFLAEFLLLAASNCCDPL